jgi:prepilin-type N-terminal cleavage/methylation domain-containing protein
MTAFNVMCEAQYAGLSAGARIVRSCRKEQTVRGRGGFTLLELLVVVVILGIGLTALSGVFVSALVSDMKGERLATATYRAQEELERIRGAEFGNALVDSTIFPSSEGYTIIQQNANKTGVVGFSVPGLPGAIGRITIAYYQSPVGIYPNLKDIRVTITWGGGRQAQSSVVLGTLLGNRP